MNLRDYVGQEVRKKKAKKKFELPILKWRKREKHWARLYLMLRSKRTGENFYRIPNSQRMIKAFRKLLKQVTLYEQRTRLKVNPKIYIQAHFDWYGPHLFPNQMISRISMDLYVSHAAVKNVRTIVITPQQDLLQQDAMLRSLAELRQEPPAIVLSALKRSGLFTRKFLRERGVR